MAERSDKERTVIARWEQGAVAPSLDTLIELVRSCGFDIPLSWCPTIPSLETQSATKSEITARELGLARRAEVVWLVEPGSGIPSAARRNAYSLILPANSAES